MATSTLHELKALISSFHPIVVVETVEEDRVESILQTAARDLGMILFDWSATRGLVRVPGTASFFNTSEPLGALQHIEGLSIEAICHLKDFSPHLEHAAVVRAMRELARRFRGSRSTLVVTGYPVALPPDLAASAVHLQWQLPRENELRAMLSSLIRSLAARRNINIGLAEGDVDALVRALSGLTLSQARSAVAYAAMSDGRLDPSDVAAITERKAALLRDGALLDFIPADANRFEIGGFGRLKQWLTRAKIGFSPEARALNLDPPRGILLVGVQGCGKSLAAKFVAREWALPLLKLDSSRIYDKYVGETEKNLRRVFSIAEAMAPVVLWIDEIEKAFATGGSGDADAGLSRRVLGSFLTWLQEKRAEVFVIGAANDLSVLPPELLRKGRFDEIFFVDLPDDEERKEIFAIHLRLRKQSPGDHDLERLSKGAEGFSGAEIEQAVVASLYRALHEKRTLDTGLVLEELASTVPLSRSRAEDVAHLRETARGRFVPVR